MSFDKTWEEQAGTWAQFARSPQHDHFFWTFNGPQFLELLPEAGHCTLDVACGEGRLGRLLAERGHRVIAVDASPSMARLAHEAAGQTVLVAEAGGLPLASQSVDLVTAFMSLQDIPDLDAAVAEIARVLVPDGRFCLAIAHPIRSAGQFAGKHADSDFVIKSYFDRTPWPWRSQHTGMRVELPGIHRSLAAYTRAIEDAGLVIETLREPRPTADDVADHAESARWLRLPCFLHLRAMPRPARRTAI
jgi:SAM-dependent methyltransferase